MLRASMALVSLVWASSATAQTKELQLVEELRLGSIDGSEADMFGDIHDMAVDPDGRIYVIDTAMKSVRLFGRDGRLIRQFAPEGDGPGERRHRRMSSFSGPARVTWDKNRGWLWIDDGYQFQIMDSLGVEYRREVRTGTLNENPNDPVGKLMAVDTQGRIYEYQRDYQPGASGDSSFSYIARGVATPDYGTRYRDTLVIDARLLVTEGTQTNMRTVGRVLATVAMTTKRPERAERIWTVSPDGAIWIADSQERRIHELGFAGDTIRTLDVGFGIAELDVSPEGWVWVRYATEGRSTWDLIDDCGVSRGSVSVPQPVSVTEVGSGGTVHVVSADELDIEYIMRLQLKGEAVTRIC